MRWLRAILTVTLAVVWMPLTAHCQLETLTGLEVLRCPSVEANESPADSHCDHGLCCGWESSQYHVLSSQPLSVPPLLAVVSPMLASAESSVPSEWSADVLAGPPPGPPRPWQFTLRTALPVRAPSIPS